jgi:hypothetical protein
LAAGEDADPRGLTLVGADVQGELDLASAAVTVPLHFVGCTFDEAPDFRHARFDVLTFTCCALPALLAEYAAMSGRLHIEHGVCDGMLALGGCMGVPSPDNCR